MRWVDLGTVAAIVSAGAVYLGVVATQGSPVEPVHWIVAVSVAAAALTAGVGCFVRARWARTLLFGWTAFVSLLWAFLGALSVGAFFVPAAVFAFVAARS